MKTVEFAGDPIYGDPFTIDHLMYYQYTVKERIPEDHSGTYVLASEATERIKVLEDALRLTEAHLGWGDSTLENVHKIVRAALEVKP
jgi:hypothetical protein